MNKNDIEDVNIEDLFDDDDDDDDEPIGAAESIGGDNKPSKEKIFINYQSDPKNPKPSPELADTSLEILNESNQDAPYIFHRSGVLCQVRTDEHGQPLIEVLDKSGIRAMLSRAADWKRWQVLKKGVVEEYNVSVPMEVVEHMMAIKDFTDFPALKGVSNHPVLREDGSWYSEGGYDKETGYYINPTRSVDLSEIGKMDIEKAVDLFNELVFNFPFEDQSSKCHALAFALNPLIRPLVGSAPTPMFVFDAPRTRTGKSLLANSITCVVTGAPIKAEPAPRRAEEWQKNILTLLVEGREIIFYDNVKTTAIYPLSSDALCSAITAGTVTGRELGYNRSLTAQVISTWSLSGNNVQLDEELTHRSLIIRMVDPNELPEDRDVSEFKHKLPKWALEERDLLFEALASIISNWFDKGQPLKDDLRFAGFEDWASIMGGIMDCCGMAGLLENRKKYSDRVNLEHAAWQAFALAVVEEYGENKWCNRKSQPDLDVFHIASYGDNDDEEDTSEENRNILEGIVHGATERQRRTLFGKLIRDNIQRIFSGHQLQICETSDTRRDYYRFVKVVDTDEDQDSQETLFGEDPNNDVVF